MNRLLVETLSFFPARPLRWIFRQKLIAPFYHLVNDCNPVHTKHLYQIKNINQFIKDLDFLAQNYVPVKAEDLVLCNKSNNAFNNNFFLSFDDGFRECYEIIAPILKKKGIPVTFFINSAFIDNKELFFRNKASILIDAFLQRKSNVVLKEVIACFQNNGIVFTDFQSAVLKLNFNQRAILDDLAVILEVNFDEYLRNQKPYMSSSEIQSLIKDGFSIGAHSVNHPRYTDIPFEEQISQTRQSLNYLNTAFNTECKIFAFPFTDFGISLKFFNEIFNKDPGTVNLTFGTSGLKRDIVKQNIQRIPMEEVIVPAKAIINKEYLYYGFKSLFGKNNMSRK